MTQQVVMQDNLTVIVCGECGISFAVPERWRQQRQDDGKEFYCPNGHCRVYRESTVKKLEKEVARKQAQLDQADAQQRELRKEVDHKERQLCGTKGALAKTKKRLRDGLCPCCHEKFADVGKHMQEQHPDYGAEPAPAEQQQ